MAGSLMRMFISIIKPTRFTNFSNLFLQRNSTCFGQFLCPSSGVFHCTHGNVICHTGLLTSWYCSQTVSKPVWHIPLPCVQCKTPDDGQRNCPKHVEFYSKNKFEKLVHLVGFIIKIYHDVRSPESQNEYWCSLKWKQLTIFNGQKIKEVFCWNKFITNCATKNGGAQKF